MVQKATNVVILGSTGSIGQNAIRVIQHLNQLHKRGITHRKYEVVGLVANANWQELLRQARIVRPRAIALMNEKARDCLRSVVGRSAARVCREAAEIHRLISAPDVDIVLMAIAGSEALPFTLSAVKAGKTVALANKEGLVMAGETLMETCRRRGGKILPVDSEHSAIFQALHCGQSAEVRRVVLTASGGPFYNYPFHKLRKVTPRQALKHPTWRMGEKITIDSATLLNKALEIVEARWLFNLRPEQIKVVIHPQSIIHSLVEFRDGSIMAQMSRPDMKIPIQFALTYPERLPGRDGASIWQKSRDLTFYEPDKKQAAALELGYEVIRRGGTAGAVLNAANEEAVNLFMNRRIGFTDIIPMVARVLRRHQVRPNCNLAEILAADRWARTVVQKEY